ncbi:hypothetical protein D9756_003138 [Leucocoprinus leucothites]|uniref:Uncharacterized protein n=1 Tax=Leucocoprinus leucothites TaxID=201217 RepID=A0A8H5G6P0_9AGAR|nr:hypothetical protein D9756_003138 [Leucoagaricus leucothites]
MSLDPEQPAITPLLAPTPEDLAAVKVFPLIQALKKDVTVCRPSHITEYRPASVTPTYLCPSLSQETIDTALSWEQLNASDINFAIVRPLVIKYARLRNMATVYACLVVRSYFQAQADVNLAFAMVMQSRASLCELLAVKLVSRFASSYMQLVAVLTTAWSPLAGASQAVVDEVKCLISKHDLETAQTALEMAISTRSKAFLATPVTQNVVNDIYSGNVVFSLLSTRSILADNYKPRAIQIYDVHKAPFLNHYRLRVPRYGAILEFLNFTILLTTFVLCLANRDKALLTFWEVIFMVIAVAHLLEEYTAAKEHGWYIYIANMWNAFDLSFMAIFLVYFVLRIKGLRNDDVIMKFDGGTLISVKNEALFSYQPPFNILAFAILKPASWILSPRALHTVNVLLIKLTSLPQLIVIALYERYFKATQKIRPSSKDAAPSIFQNLPRHIKNVPLLEALLGSSHNDIYDAILDIEMDEEYDIFADFEDEEGRLFGSRLHSREQSVAGDLIQAAGTGAEAQFSQPPSAVGTTSRRRLRTTSAWSTSAPRRLGIPHSRMVSAHVPSTAAGDQKLTPEGYGSTLTGSTVVEGEEAFPPRITTSLSGGSNGSSGFMSPLARLFNPRNSFVPSAAEQSVIAASNETSLNVKKVEALLAEVKGLPVNKLKEEMKEIQERQNRIESLLLMLTRGMRNDKL